MSTMKAIHIVDPTAGAIGLELTDIPIPSLSTPYDILVKVMGGSLNPGELQYRAMSPKGTILGFDGAGLVVEAGPEAMFSKGDAVLYCGDCQRQGSNAQYHVVDSRLAGRKPEALGWSDAASLPLVGITAWEMFEDRFRLKPGDNQKEILLVVNGAGGVGSVAIQLAKTVFGIKRVIATASRPETIAFVKELGATDVIDHRVDLGPQLKALGIEPTLVFINHDTARYVKEIEEHIAPFGQIGSVVGSMTDSIPIHGMTLWFRSISFHWELQQTRVMFKRNVETHGQIVTQLAQLRAAGTLKNMVTKRETFSLASLRAAHDLQASGTIIGKIAFTFPEVLE